MFGSLAKLNKK